MPTDTDSLPDPDTMRTVLRDAAVTGGAVLVPFLVTLVVLGTIVDFVYGELALLAGAIDVIPGVDPVASRAVLTLLAVALLALSAVGVGLYVNRTTSGAETVEYVEDLVTRVPGVGPVYDSFRKMSDSIVESDVRNFREVKLVEFPDEGMYTLGFLTAESPPAVREAAGHDEMVTVFLPLAPNPVMGGHLIQVPAERVRDVEMTVEEGMRAVVTTGVASDAGTAAAPGDAGGGGG